MKETEVKRVSITLVGNSNPRDVEYGGVVELPEGHTVGDVETLYGEWRRSDARCGFTDWLVRRGFKEDRPVGHVILFAEDYPGNGDSEDLTADQNRMLPEGNESAEAPHSKVDETAIASLLDDEREKEKKKLVSVVQFDDGETWMLLDGCSLLIVPEECVDSFEDIDPDDVIEAFDLGTIVRQVIPEA